MNNLDLTVLRALARLSRARKVVDYEALALRAGGSIEDVRGSLARLARQQLVDRATNVGGVRLTFAGLAVAVGSGAAVVAPRARAVRTPQLKLVKRRAA